MDQSHHRPSPLTRALMLSLPLLAGCMLEPGGDESQAEQVEDGGLDSKKGAKKPKEPKPPKNGGSTGGGTTGGTGGQTQACREGVIDPSRGAADDRPACTEPYPWPASGAVSSWKDYCGLCAASTAVPYRLDDPAEQKAYNLYAGRIIGSPPTTCVNALLSSSAFPRTSQACADFRETYSGVCCGSEPACAYSATWYQDSPTTACSDPSASDGCRCADGLTAPGRPNHALSFAESTFSATSPFATAVRNGSLCGVRVAKNVYGTGQYETTCARLYEAARRGLTGRYECGVMEKMLSESCGSRPITP